MNVRVASRAGVKLQGLTIGARVRLAVTLGIIIIWSLIAILFRSASPFHIALAHPNGGGYAPLTESGVSETIKHNGSVILPAGQGGTYCCGFTFQVAMQYANEEGLIDHLTAKQVRRLQQMWYGVTPGSEWRQSAMAMEEFRIGREVDLEEAEPGDIVTIHRESGMGHSVILVRRITSRNGDIVGLEYRSSQPTTLGVGNMIEFFSDTQYSTSMSGIRRDKTYIARLKAGWI